MSRGAVHFYDTLPMLMDSYSHGGAWPCTLYDLVSPLTTFTLALRLSWTLEAARPCMKLEYVTCDISSTGTHGMLVFPDSLLIVLAVRAPKGG
jgi:hypothetical protein